MEAWESILRRVNLMENLIDHFTTNRALQCRLERKGAGGYFDAGLAGVGTRSQSCPAEV
jgi:hypothetical protein